jgi:hypothetical protein
MPKGYPPEFRRKVLDLLAAGRSVGDVAADLGISGPCIHNWRKQDRIDRGELPGLNSAEREERAAARWRIRVLKQNWRQSVDPSSCSRRRCPQETASPSSR